MRRRRGWGLIAICVSGIATARAQSPFTAAPTDSLRLRPGVLRLTGIVDGDRLRVRTLDDFCVEGTFESPSIGGRLRLVSKPRDIALDSVAAMWVRESAATRGALHGLVLGLVGSIMLASGDRDAVPVVLLPIGTTAAGALIGARIPRWRPVPLQPGLHAAGSTPCDTTRCLTCALARLRPGTSIRVEATASRYFEGEVESSSKAGIDVRQGDQTARVAHEEILRLSARQNVAGKSAAMGSKSLALAGGIAGAVMGALWSNFCYDCTNPHPTRTAVTGALIGGLMGAAVGGVVGAIAGGAAGAPFHAWVQLYP